VTPDALEELRVEQRVRRLRRAQMRLACFAEQRAAIADSARLKAFLCTRRAGKSYGIGTDLCSTALEHPGSSSLYLGLTRMAARAILNKDIMRPIVDRFGIDAKWVKSDSAWTFANGSLVYLAGADVSEDEIHKWVGQKYRKVYIDEASKFRHDLREIVYGSLQPAMGDELGTIILSGTPTNATTGLFYDVTCDEPREPGWSTHRWSWRENPHIRANLQKVYDELLARNPALAGTPRFQQEWDGKWVADLSALVYRASESLNSAPSLPRPASEYTFVLGVDLGYNDPTALVVVAYHRFDPTLFVVSAEKRPGLTFDDVAEWVKPITRRYQLGAMVFDAADLQGVETLRQRHQLPIEAAKKQGKRGVIAALNSDLQAARVKVLPAAAELFEEWGSLVWDDRGLSALPQRWEEDPRFPNHLADAFLYAWRKSRNYDTEKETPPPADPVKESQRATEELLQQMRERRNQQSNPRNRFDRPPNGWRRP
jgi:hypothetical protein